MKDDKHQYGYGKNGCHEEEIEDTNNINRIDD